MKVVLPPWRQLINERFIPLMSNVDRYLILYGGRGSGKSDAIAKKLIKRCLTEKFFRFVLYRKVYNTIKDSQFQNIKDIIYEWGLQSLFTFTESPLLIRCVNGNKFICRGGDEPGKLKSIKDPTGVWYEEEIPDENDFITITASIRTKKALYLQEVFTINPEIEGADYKEHWFWKQFFKDKDELNFSDITTVELPATLLLPARTVELTYTCHHSTFQDNKWIPDEFIGRLIKLKETNEYYYTIYALGVWGVRSTDGNFYKLFKRAKNVLSRHHLWCRYNPNIALHLTFDFNVHPYVTICIHQVVGKRAVQIDEICLPTPNNKTDLACKEFVRRYPTHKGGVFVYGDPSGVKEDTRTEKGYNDFLIIAKELLSFAVQMRYQKSAPPVVMRGMFINEVFDSGFEGLEFYISDACVHTVADYQNLKEASDGTKAKIKVKNKDTGVSYEKYGHTSDANDYFYCSAFFREFLAYQRGNVVRKPKTGNNASKNRY